MRFLAAILALTMLAGPALAQAGLDKGKGARTRYTEEEKRREAESERAYRDALKATRGSVTETYDPWKNIRPETPKK